MNSESVQRNIIRLASLLKPVLEGESYHRMHELAASVEGTSSSAPWQLMIPPANPITFTRSQVDRLLVPDIYCDIKGPAASSDMLSKQSLVIRVWSVGERYSFRDAWDAAALQKRISDANHHRVMFRCHFDKAGVTQTAPLFHVQIGGRSQQPEREMCWFPDGIDLPRLPYPPIDFVLACELVVANFFPSVYKDLSTRSKWLSLVRESEVFLLSKFYGSRGSMFRHEGRIRYTMLSRSCGLSTDDLRF